MEKSGRGGEGSEQLLIRAHKQNIYRENVLAVAEEIRGMAVERRDRLSGEEEGHRAHAPDANVWEREEAEGFHEARDFFERGRVAANDGLRGDDVHRLPLVDDSEQCDLVTEDFVLQQQTVEIFEWHRAAQRGLQFRLVAFFIEKPLGFHGEPEAVRLGEFYRPIIRVVAPDKMLLAALPRGREKVERIDDQPSRTREGSERFCFAISNMREASR